MTKVNTIKIPSGGEYAKVSERLKLFRSEAPNGSISTESIPMSDGNVVLKATIIKDQKTEGSPSATGQAFGKISGQKGFEKLETIAVGRALAFLGYLASGEVASSEEMQEFLDYKAGQKQAVIDSLLAAKTVDELKKLFIAAGTYIGDADVIKTKDEMKAKLA
jgi:hypothetical protein